MLLERFNRKVLDRYFRKVASNPGLNENYHRSLDKFINELHVKEDLDNVDKKVGIDADYLVWLEMAYIKKYT